jgi:antitoxin ParD1/3/4
MSTTSLPPDLEKFVHDQLASGKYQSSADVLTDAVRLLRDRELRREELRTEIDRGIRQLEAGECVDLDSDAALEAFFDDADARGRKRLSARPDGQ